MIYLFTKGCIEYSFSSIFFIKPQATSEDSTEFDILSEKNSPGSKKTKGIWYLIKEKCSFRILLLISCKCDIECVIDRLEEIHMLLFNISRDVFG